ncbi:MAG: DUF2461 domain-containing protein, partial [Thermoplasmata archaeon]|nr:DUF2461 domain-containing protein [Thermoplasmata archaeon]
ELGTRLSEISPHVVADPRPFGGSLSRIYRDTRFSKDKSPYRTTIGIHFGHDRAEHGESLPGFYLHLAPGECFVASGVWRPEPQALGKIRQRIATAPAAWANVLAAGIRLEGESYARVPRGYDPDQRYAEDLRRKDFITSLPLTDSAVSGPQFGASFLRACRKVDPLNRFLAVAIGVPW